MHNPTGTAIANVKIETAQTLAEKEPLLRIVNLKKHFFLSRSQKLHAVDGINLQIAENKIVGLVGESGSGKSTLGKTIVGLLDKTEGDVFYAGQRLPKNYQVRDFRCYARKMQMIFQDPYSSLNPRMTAYEAVSEPLCINNEQAQQLCQQERRDLVAHWFEKVGLDLSHMGRYPHQLSGGQCQRLNIARALISSPKFIVCDEPVSALDVSIQAQIVNLLKEIQSQDALSLLFIAHDLSMVRYISDYIAVMYLGHVVEVGPADEVYRQPLHPYTKSLIEANPCADPRIEKKRQLQSISGEPSSAINPKSGCLFAPRCRQASNQCQQTKPPQQLINGQHQVACFLYG